MLTLILDQPLYHAGMGLIKNNQKAKNTEMLKFNCVCVVNSSAVNSILTNFPIFYKILNWSTIKTQLKYLSGKSFVIHDSAKLVKAEEGKTAINFDSSKLGHTIKQYTCILQKKNININLADPKLQIHINAIRLLFTVN